MLENYAPIMVRRKKDLRAPKLLLASMKYEGNHLSD